MNNHNLSLRKNSSFFLLLIILFCFSCLSGCRLAMDGIASSIPATHRYEVMQRDSVIGVDEPWQICIISRQFNRRAMIQMRREWGPVIADKLNLKDYEVFQSPENMKTPEVNGKNVLVVHITHFKATDKGRYTKLWMICNMAVYDAGHHKMCEIEGDSSDSAGFGWDAGHIMTNLVIDMFNDGYVKGNSRS